MPRLPGSVKRVSRILSRGSSTLGDLYSQTRELLELQTIVRESVPGDVYVASRTAGTLHLITPSSALATRLRYSQRTLVSSLRRRGVGDIDDIRISVRPDTSRQKTPGPRSASPPSPANARHIESTAQYIEDEPLRKALIRLSRHWSD